MNDRGTIIQLPPPILNVRLLSGDYFPAISGKANHSINVKDVLIVLLVVNVLDTCQRKVNLSIHHFIRERPGAVYCFPK